LQVYELASHLIKHYTGSGKTFYLAAEQADLQIRQQPSGKGAAAVTAVTPLDAERQEMLSKMWWEQQAAVDDARVDQANELKGVQVGGVVPCRIRSVKLRGNRKTMHMLTMVIGVQGLRNKHR
jgi:hypothetical protein